MFLQPNAGRRGRHALDAALEQRHAQLVLEQADLVADRRRDHMRGRRRARQVSVLADGEEVVELEPIHVLDFRTLSTK
ncbi:MAG: hypothetical protein R3E48_09015 [Burkholderiaceae bacterium]